MDVRLFHGLENRILYIFLIIIVPEQRLCHRDCSCQADAVSGDGLEPRRRPMPFQAQADAVSGNGLELRRGPMLF